MLLGVVLGLGFLAKAPMLPIALVFLGTALWTSRKLKDGSTGCPNCVRWLRAGQWPVHSCFVLVAAAFFHWREREAELRVVCERRRDQALAGGQGLERAYHFIQPGTFDSCRRSTNSAVPLKARIQFGPTQPIGTKG